MITGVQPHRVEAVCFSLQWMLVGFLVWLILDSWFFRAPLLQPDPVAAEPAQAEVPSARGPISVNQFQDLWTRDLRQRLIEPKAPEKPQPKASPPPPPVQLPRLTATFVESGQAWGLFRDGRGMHRVIAESETVDVFRIVRITPGSATLMRGDQSYTVNVERPQDGAHGHRARPNDR